MTATDTRDTVRNMVVAGETLRERRTRLGLSRHKLAAEASCSLTTLANIEHGVTRKGYAIERVNRVLTDMENT